MDPLNPFNIGIQDIGFLSPRRRRYIQERNVAQDQQIDDIAGAILKYKEVIDEVRKRYQASELEDQLSVKPYLAALYFEIGRLFEKRKDFQNGLTYYEHAGRYGHEESLVCAERLGTKEIFDLPANQLEGRGSQTVDPIFLLKVLRRHTVLIEGKQKGSGVVVKDPLLGQVLVTVPHVSTSMGEAFIGDQKISLKKCQCQFAGPHTLFDFNQVGFQIDNPLPKLVLKEIEIGEEVYFGGFPFRETDVHLHIGRVSSVGKNGTFKIDGTAVPGMSGGPIAILRDGELYVVGTITSETFDPVEGFSDAREEMYLAQADQESRAAFNHALREKMANDIKQNSHFIKIPRGNLYIDSLDDQKLVDPQFFYNVWDDLHKQGVILEDGTVVSEKIVMGQLGLREEFLDYESEVIDRLSSCVRNMSIEADDVQLQNDWREPTDSLNTVGLSLVQSLSTGVISGCLFQEMDEMPLDEEDQLAYNGSSLSEPESSEFEIGRKNRIERDKKKFAKQGVKIRAEAKKKEGYENVGIPRVLYRFVTHTAAKEIKKSGIIHQGSELDEIPFITQPKAKIARSVGAVSTDRLLVIYTDRIPGLTKENISTLKQQNGVTAYKLNLTIPPEAIEIGEGGN